MFKKILLLIPLIPVISGLTGCVLIMGALADSAKAKENVNFSYSETLDIVRGALKTINIEFESAVIKKDITQVRGKYTNGRLARIFITRVSADVSRISVRVGTSEAGKKDAQEILRAIMEYAGLTRGAIKDIAK